MKKIITLLGFIAPISLYPALNNATSVSDGSISTNANWIYNITGTAPTQKDTLYIDHAMTFTSLNWSLSAIDVIVIRSTGSLSPSGANRTLTLPATAIILIEPGGRIYNGSGNNSNHAIVIGTVHVWGKGACVGGNIEVWGPVQFDATNPCGYYTLPVTLVTFAVEARNNQKVIRWTTADESDVDHYTVEVSTDGSTFAVVSETAAFNNLEGVNHYSALDDQTRFERTLYYRLTAHFTDGSSKFLDFVKITAKPHALVIVDQSEILIRVEGSDASFQAEIFDLQGKLICTSQIEGSGSISTEKLLQGQVCILRARDSNGVIEQMKFVR